MAGTASAFRCSSATISTRTGVPAARRVCAVNAIRTSADTPPGSTAAGRVSTVPGSGSSAPGAMTRTGRPGGTRLVQIPPRVLQLLLRRDAVLDECGQARDVRLGVLDVRLRGPDFRTACRDVRGKRGDLESHEQVAGGDAIAFGLRHLDDPA